jgi:putative transposase
MTWDWTNVWLRPTVNRAAHGNHPCTAPVTCTPTAPTTIETTQNDAKIVLMPYDPARHHRRSIRLQGYDYTRPGAYFVTIVTQGRACLFGEVMAGEMRMNDAGRMVQQVWDELALFYEGVQTDAFIVMPNHVHGIIILTGNVRATPHVHPDEMAVRATPRGCPTTPRGCPNPQSGPGQARGPAPTSGSGQARGPAPTSGSGQAQGPAPTSGSGQARGPAPTSGSGQARGPAPTAATAPTLGLPDVVHRFKTMTTKRYADGVRANQWTPFPGRLWQRNYYEHIIRDVGANGGATSRSPLQRIREYILTNPLRWHLDRERDIGADPLDVIGDGT